MALTELESQLRDIGPDSQLVYSGLASLPMELVHFMPIEDLVPELWFLFLFFPSKEEVVFYNGLKKFFRLARLYDRMSERIL